MAIMNRSVLNRLSTERIDRDARESAATALLEDSANSGVGLALLVRARHKALRKEEAEKQEALKVTLDPSQENAKDERQREAAFFLFSFCLFVFFAKNFLFLLALAIHPVLWSLLILLFFFFLWCV